MSEAEARAWPDLFEILERKVKPAREKLGNTADALALKKNWWQWWRSRPALRSARNKMDRVLMHPFTSSNLAFAFVPSSVVIASPHPVFTVDSFSSFASLQSRVHEVWARFFGSSMKDDLRYTPSDCFETFPFPIDWRQLPALETSGRAYYELRATLMIRNDEGLTKTYNRFHDPDERDPISRNFVSYTQQWIAQCLPSTVGGTSQSTASSSSTTRSMSLNLATRSHTVTVGLTRSATKC